jgi:hypothetical protein
MAQPKVFVSYSHRDDAFAMRFIADLRSAGAWVWADDGELWSNNPLQRISEGLSSCEWFVQVLTPDAIMSRWVTEEVLAAIHMRLQGKIRGVLFIRAAPVLDDDLPALWSTYKIIDAMANYSTALNDILKAVGITPSTANRLNRSETIFISYRRDDSEGHAGRLHDNLIRRYGESTVFMDLAIEPGADFVTTLEDAVGSCAVLLAVIGRQWLTVTNVTTGKRRLDDPNDFVRIEIVTALRRGIGVIPILVHNARMPGTDDLPDDLKSLARRQAQEMTALRWEYDFGKLSQVLDKAVGSAK